jgi:DNA-binding NarL/FixJ family response regulator
VLLADGHPIVLKGLRNILESEYLVVGEAMDGRELLAAAEQQRPDLVIAEISMPVIDGIEATRRLKGIAPKALVLILSIYTEPRWVQAAFDAGAHAYLPKTSAPEEIATAIRAVLKGLFYVSAMLIPAMIDTGRSELFGAMLTPRELDIIRLISRGLSSKEIAHDLGVSAATVRAHLSRLLAKLADSPRGQLSSIVFDSRKN